MTPAIVVKRIREVYSHDMHNPPGCGPCELTRRGHPAREQARRLFYLIVKPETLAQSAEFWPDAKLKTQNSKPKTQNIPMAPLSALLM